MSEIYPLIKVERTSPSVCEAIARILIDEKVIPDNKSIADLSYKIAESLGFKNEC